MLVSYRNAPHLLVSHLADDVDNTIVRVDTVTTTVTREVPVVQPRLLGPMFWGLYAGTTWPEGSIDKVYTNGYHFGGVLGWDPARSFVGFRLDGGLSQLGKEQGSLTETQQGDGTSLIVHLAGDAKVKVLSEMIKHHVKEEEKPGGMFAKARKAGMDLEDLGERLVARKSQLEDEGADGGPGGVRSHFDA